MKTHHKHQDVFLLTFTEFESLISEDFPLFKNKDKSNILVSYGNQEKIISPNTYLKKGIKTRVCPYHKFTDWIKNFIIRPNILLGREGSVCPYVSCSLKKQLFFCTVYSGDTSQNTIEEKLLQYRDWFLEFEVKPKQNEVFKTFVILLANILDRDTPKFMKTIHTRLKTEFVSKGLMLGEFFPGYSQEGLWNPKFSPLSSPLPLFVIRYMVANDYYFLKDNKLFFELYLHFFQNKIPENLEKLVKETAKNYQITF
ncbi:MAG: hypothetical protein QNJ72_29880 [Pleurocapsa sp. MO_226.B13]|nr:hypothetical protein [Pleurocapsa sp. MO_226.B13]